MSSILRALLLVMAILTAWWILNKIRKSKVKMEDAIFWIFFTIILAVLGLVPEVSYKLSDLLGIESPANLVFLIMIFIMIWKAFILSITVSQLEEKVTTLTAEVALRTHDAESKIEEIMEQDNK